MSPRSALSPSLLASDLTETELRAGAHALHRRRFIMKTNRRAAREQRPRPERIGRPDDGNAFVPDTIGQARPLPVPEAESIAEEFIDAATRAGPVAMEATDEVVPEEEGGPFLFLDDDGNVPSEPIETQIEEDAFEEEREESRGADWTARGL